MKILEQGESEFLPIVFYCGECRSKIEAGPGEGLPMAGERHEVCIQCPVCGKWNVERKQRNNNYASY